MVQGHRDDHDVAVQYKLKRGLMSISQTIKNRLALADEVNNEESSSHLHHRILLSAKHKDKVGHTPSQGKMIWDIIGLSE